MPGPDGNFFNDLKYLHGFIQIQDLIDRAIIKEMTGDAAEVTTGVYTQQQPYPCFTRDKYEQL